MRLRSIYHKPEGEKGIGKWIVMWTWFLALFYSKGKAYVDRWELKLKAYAKMAKVRNIDWVERTARYKRKLDKLKQPYKYRL